MKTEKSAVVGGVVHFPVQSLDNGRRYSGRAVVGGGVVGEAVVGGAVVGGGVV